MSVPASYQRIILAILCIPLAMPAMAYKWPGNGPSPGGAISAKVIGKHCPGVLSAAEIAELDAYIAKAASEQAQQAKDEAAKNSGSPAFPFETFATGLAAQYEQKYRDGKTCDAGDTEEAQDMLARVRKVMAGGGPLYPSPSDPSRRPQPGEVIIARIAGEKCMGTLSALEIAELQLYLARGHVEFARTAADADARVMMEQEKWAAKAIADGFSAGTDCNADAVAKAKDVAARVRRSDAAGQAQ